MSLFPTTRWTLVLEARSESEKAQALQALLAAYRAPLYVFARRSGLAPADAEDAVQSFAVVAIERDLFARADKEKGKLRSFLKTAFRHHLSDERERGGAQKRGGHVPHLDFSEAEAFVASRELNPERAFDAKWARVVMARALEETQAELESEQRALVSAYFDGEITGLKEAAEKAHMSEAKLKSILHRARGRYRAHLLQIVRGTVAPEASAEDELRALMDAAS